MVVFLSDPGATNPGSPVGSLRSIFARCVESFGGDETELLNDSSALFGADELEGFVGSERLEARFQDVESVVRHDQALTGIRVSFATSRSSSPFRARDPVKLGCGSSSLRAKVDLPAPR